MEFGALNATDIEAIFSNNENNETASRFPFYPLNSPGIPLPGPDFIEHAQALGDSPAIVTKGRGSNAEVKEFGWFIKNLYLRALWAPDRQMFPVDVSGRTEHAKMVPGHMWGADEIGPVVPPITHEFPRVMVVGKMPGPADVAQNKNMCGDAGDLFKNILQKCGVTEEEYQWWYMCNVVRWPELNPQGGALSQRWIKDCLPILHQEFRLWQPDYILCLGSESTKAICGSKNTLKSMAGRWIEIDIPRHEQGAPAVYHKAKVMAVTNPKAVLRSTDQLSSFEAAVTQFVKLLRGEDFTREHEYEIQVVKDGETLGAIVEEVIALPGIKKISVDAEWNGDHPGEKNSYVRTIQFTYKDNHAVVVVFNAAGGIPVFEPDQELASDLLRILFDRDDVQIRGSFFSADLPWLEYLGIPIAKRFTVPENVADLNGGDYAGGFDVALAMHAYDETGELKLEVMCNRYCNMPRWDNELREWLAKYATDKKLKSEDIEGFGECPGDILYPYGGKDVIGTHKLAELQQRELLNKDRYGNASWIPFHTSMLAFPAFNEMHTVGVKVDYERIDSLTDEFMEVRDRTLDEFRREINWPEFNPRSAHHCRDLLFGPDYTGKKDSVTGKNIAVGPPDAKRLFMKPVKTTGTRGKLWAQVEKRKEEHKYSPSTDKETLGILGLYNPTALKLRDIRLIDQVLKSVFRPPTVVDRGTDKEKGAIAINAEGHRVYAGGVASYITHDGRLRSWFLQTMDTGRASSSRPPLQNLSKRREDDYGRIIGDSHRYPVRSFITSNMAKNYSSKISSVITEPTVFVEADYTGAELMSIAIMARSKNMIDHCLRSNLPEDDPNHYDLHSHVAVETFGLNCPPTKKGLAAVGHKGKRVGAKNVIFGGNYGRSAEAIARQCQEEGVEMSVEEVQQVMNALYTRYSEIPVLQSQLRARVGNEGWLRSCMGRLRRFIPSADKQVMGELERQALNFPFQSHVADAVSLALHYLMTHENRDSLGYRVVLTIHDAIVLEVPVRSVDAVVDSVLPECMVDRVAFQACDCNGHPYQDSPFYNFGIDVDVMTHWGVTPSKKECEGIGIDSKYGKVVE